MPEPKSGHDDTMRIAFMVNNKPDLRIISVSTPLQSIIQVRIETVDHLVYSPFNTLKCINLNFSDQFPL